MPESGFAYRLAYLRWLRNRGRVKPETDAQVAAWLGVGVKWLGKWKARPDAPDGRREARAVETALVAMGATLAWLYDDEGPPPEPALWQEWVTASQQRRGATEQHSDTEAAEAGLPPDHHTYTFEEIKQAEREAELIRAHRARLESPPADKPARRGKAGGSR